MAHPDDEILLASSIIESVDQIVLCYEDVTSFPEWGEGRRRSIAAFPHPNVASLGLLESETFNSAAWPEPTETEYGLAVRRWRGSLRGYSETRYRDTHARLIEALHPLLAGRQVVFTHNPWGEYGHEEHVQVFRAVAALRERLGFEIRVSCYVSNKSYALMQRCLPRLDCGSPPLPTNPRLGAEIQALYTANNCWTWFDDHAWPSQESFYRVLGPGETPVPLHAGRLINLIWIDWRRPPPFSRARRFARRAARLVSTATGSASMKARSMP
jgi:LmbE family N-acetylglucosaminyl deacetylase